jgi:hypothetical protein
MPHLQNFSYRSLERLCRMQARLASTRATRDELERMACEYATLADHHEQLPPTDDSSTITSD